MPRVCSIPASQQRQAYDYYFHHRSVSQKTIAAFLGVSVAAFRRLRVEWGWPARPRAAARSEARDTLPATPGGEAAGSSLRDAAAALVGATRSRIEALVKEQRSGRAMDHDKTARTLASYAKTLAAAQTLLEQEGSTSDDSPVPAGNARSLQSLRDELAQHLERVVAEEEARGGDGLLV